MKIFKSESFMSIVASIFCIVGGMLVGALVLIILAAFSNDIPLYDAFYLLNIIFGCQIKSSSA